MRNLHQRIKKLEASQAQNIADIPIEVSKRILYLQLRWYVDDGLNENDIAELSRISKEWRDPIFEKRWFDPHEGEINEVMLTFIRDMSCLKKYGDLEGDLIKKVEAYRDLHLSDRNFIW
ncbi:MAG: hypothetical protein ACH255_20485 [Candidatus Thiodiazotropha sp.]